MTLSVLWTVLLYFAGETYNRIEEFMQERLAYVLVYLTAGALVALITCYRLGPPVHPRTLDIIRWTLQVCIISYRYQCYSLNAYITLIYKPILCLFTGSRISTCSSQ